MARSVGGDPACSGSWSSLLSRTDTLIATPLRLRRYASFRRISAGSTATGARCLSRGPIIEVTKLLCFTAGVAVADFEDFNLLEPRRRANFEDVTLVRLHQRPGDRRYLAHLTATEIGLVDTDDCDGLYVPALVGIGDGRAEKDLVQLLLLFWVHHLGALQPR